VNPTALTANLMLKLQAFAALGVAILAAAFYGFWYFGVMTPVTPETAGLDIGASNISRLAVGVIFLAIISVGIAFFRQLWNGAKNAKQ
jgi:hypothetical protein